MLKTLAFALLLSSAASPVCAQSLAPAGALPIAYQHCILVSLGDAYASSRIRLEYGQGAKLPVRDAQMVQDNQAVAKLGSVVSALNYMSLRGWECINVSTITSSGAYSSSTDSQVGYLLRRRAQ